MAVVFLLHGMGATPWTLWPLEQCLRKWGGYQRTHRLSYPVDQLTFGESVDFVDELMAKHADKETEEVILVGQSMGGLVANRLHTKGWQVKVAIYIGAPLHGARLLTQLESMLPTMVRNAMYKRPYGFLMEKAREMVPPHPYHSISMAWPGTSFDGCVYRDEATLHPQHHTHLPWADHRTVFANPRLWWHVLHHVKTCVTEGASAPK
jgi:pimeloyl-ACP methyl ester carboxylesterase